MNPDDDVPDVSCYPPPTFDPLAPERAVAMTIPNGALNPEEYGPKV